MKATDMQELGVISSLGLETTQTTQDAVCSVLRIVLPTNHEGG